MRTKKHGKYEEQKFDQYNRRVRKRPVIEMAGAMRFCGSHERLCEEGLTLCLTPPNVLVGNRTHNQCLRSVMKSSLSHIAILIPLLMNCTCNQCPTNVPRSHIFILQFLLQIRRAVMKVLMSKGFGTSLQIFADVSR